MPTATALRTGRQRPARPRGIVGKAAPRRQRPSTSKAHFKKMSTAPTQGTERLVFTASTGAGPLSGIGHSYTAAATVRLIGREYVPQIVYCHVMSGNHKGEVVEVCNIRAPFRAVGMEFGANWSRFLRLVLGDAPSAEIELRQLGADDGVDEEDGCVHIGARRLSEAPPAPSSSDSYINDGDDSLFEDEESQ